MAVFRQDGAGIPDWCELRGFAPQQIAAGESLATERSGEREIVVSTGGTVQVDWGSGGQFVAEGQSLALPAGVQGYSLRAVTRPASVMRLWGCWGSRIGGVGVFSVVPNGPAKNQGDPAPYPKETGVDRHFHDYDEYWIVIEGSGLARIDDQPVPMACGDCIATGTGHPHDIQKVNGPFRAVYLETTLRREERPGHLWEHTHGPASPDPQRI